MLTFDWYLLHNIALHILRNFLIFLKFIQIFKTFYNNYNDMILKKKFTLFSWKSLWRKYSNLGKILGNILLLFIKRKNVNSLFLRYDINLSINPDAETMHLQRGFTRGEQVHGFVGRNVRCILGWPVCGPQMCTLSINHFVARIIYGIAPRSLVTPVSVTRIVRSMARTRIYRLYVHISGYFMPIVECTLTRDWRII